ncbi:hypothetical protein, partial [Planomonospora algeriensis]
PGSRAGRTWWAGRWPGRCCWGAAGVLGARMLAQGPPESADVLYRDDFGDDTSGWYNREGSRVDVLHGYTGDGRFTMASDSSHSTRSNNAPVNAEAPEHVLVSVKTVLASGNPSGAWSGVYCQYAPEEDYFFYVAEVSPGGRARIRRSTTEDSWNLTPDVPIPDLKKDGAVLRLECERGDGRIRTTFWVDDHLVGAVVDEDVAKADGKPLFGIYVTKWPGGQTETRTYFDDFRIARLP